MGDQEQQEEQQEEKAEEQELDPFEALLEEEPEPDPTPDESEEEAAGEEEAAASEAPKGAGAEEKPAVEEELGEEKPAGTEEEPEPVTLEESEERQATLEKENFALRRDLMKHKEKKRIRDEEDRVAAIERGAEEGDPEVGVVNEEGKVVLDRAALEKQIARVHERRAAAAPVDLKAFRAELVDGYEDAAASESAMVELEQAYDFLDQEIGKFCVEADINPSQIDGMANTLAIIEETGIAAEFEKKYPGVSMTNVMLAPKSQPIMRKEHAQHIQRRATSKSAEEEEKPAVTRPKIGAKPRPMSRKGKTRVQTGGPKLTDADPVGLFDMGDDEFDELERNSAADLERRA